MMTMVTLVARSARGLVRGLSEAGVGTTTQTSVASRAGAGTPPTTAIITSGCVLPDLHDNTVLSGLVEQT